MPDEKPNLMLQYEMIQVNLLISINQHLDLLKAQLDVKFGRVIYKLDTLTRTLESSIGRLALLLVRSPATEGMAAFAERGSRHEVRISDVIEGITKSFKIKLPVDELKELPLFKGPEMQQSPFADTKMVKGLKTVKNEIMGTLSSMLKSMLLIQPLTRMIGAFLEPLEPLADTAETLGSILSLLITPSMNQLNGVFVKLVNPIATGVSALSGFTESMAWATHTITIVDTAIRSFQELHIVENFFAWLEKNFKIGFSNLQQQISAQWTAVFAPSGNNLIGGGAIYVPAGGLFH